MYLKVIVYCVICPCRLFAICLNRYVLGGTFLGLCPASVLIEAHRFSKCCQASDYLFTYVDYSRMYHMTYALFTTMLKHVVLQLGLDTSDYSGHSFRRGGATHALSVGVPAEVIKAQGDWRPLSYLGYLDQSDKSDRASVVSVKCMCKFFYNTVVWDFWGIM
jgi:hypothetical protein